MYQACIVFCSFCLSPHCIPRKIDFCQGAPDTGILAVSAVTVVVFYIPLVIAEVTCSLVRLQVQGEKEELNLVLTWAMSQTCLLCCHINVNAGMREGDDREARTRTEQVIGKGKTTSSGIITILGCLKVLMELLWEIGCLYTLRVDRW